MLIFIQILIEHSVILGVTLDEKLKYDVHTEQEERKALRSLDLLRRVKETGVVNRLILVVNA